MPLVRQTFLLTLPSKAELVSDQIMVVIDRMSDRYAEELLLDPAAIRAGHHAMVVEIFSGDQAEFDEPHSGLVVEETQRAGLGRLMPWVVKR